MKSIMKPCMPHVDRACFRRPDASGFTLIEVMIVVAIIAILAAIAYPAYTEQVAKGRRADAKAALLETAQWMERRYTMSNTYEDATLPPLRGSTSSFYAISVAGGASAPTTSTYWLEMAPTGAMANDRCGTFYVNQAGAKGTTGSSASDCWDR